MTRLTAVFLAAAAALVPLTSAIAESNADAVRAVLFPSAVAISEANACGHPELASKVRDTFTSLASDAGLGSDWADTHLSDENGRCCAHSASRCDEADLKEQMHYIEDFTRQAQTVIQGNK